MTLGRLLTTSEPGPLSPVPFRGLGIAPYQKLEASRDETRAETGLVNCRGKGLVNCREKGLVNCRGVHRLSLAAGTNTGSCSLPGPSCSPPGLVGVPPEGGPPELSWHLLQLIGGTQSLQLEMHPEAAWNCPLQVPVLQLELGEGQESGLRDSLMGSRPCPMRPALCLWVLPLDPSKPNREEGYTTMERPVVNNSSVKTPSQPTCP